MGDAFHFQILQSIFNIYGKLQTRPMEIETCWYLKLLIPWEVPMSSHGEKEAGELPSRITVSKA